MDQPHLPQDPPRLGHPGTDLRHVEAAMRSIHGTLDHLGEAACRQNPAPPKDGPPPWPGRSARCFSAPTHLPGCSRGSVTFSLAPTETLDEPTPEIRSIAEELFPVEDRLRRTWEAVSKSPDEDAMFEGRMAGDLPTEIRTVVEG